MQTVTRRQYIKKNLIAIDQLANTLFGGNPDCTISARTGYMAFNTTDRYWQQQERLIDYAFKPIDGEVHCFKSYIREHNETFYDASKLAKCAMALSVIPACIAIGIALRIYKKLEALL